jgi:N-acetylglucosaminyldiphosphoundecaprenol N-acetyl-beta-D-mannosaminyltransferase
MKEVESPVFLSERECLALDRGYLVTVNVQHIYEARASEQVSQAVFADAGARHCIDGRGAAALFGRASARSDLPLVQGNVLLRRWLKEASHVRLLVVGSNAATVRRVLADYPSVDATVDERMIRVASPSDAQSAAQEIAREHPGQWDLVALALGVPKQELLAQALQHQVAAPIYCIGGSFEILADAFPRSPAWVQAVGLEGVWRLALEPSRKRVERLFRTYATFADLYLRRASLRQLMGRS